MAEVPGPVRATLGLVAVTVDGARMLPAKAVELPVLAVSSVLQLSLRAQQRYAELTMRGDEVLGRLRRAPEEPPEWATFDESTPAPNGSGSEESGDGGADASTSDDAGAARESGAASQSRRPPVRRATERRFATDAPSATKAVVPATNAIERSPTKAVERRRRPAGERGATTGATRGGTAAKTGAGRRSTGPAASAASARRERTRPAKPVRAPRDTEPSAFDRVAEPVLEPDDASLGSPIALAEAFAEAPSAPATIPTEPIIEPVLATEQIIEPAVAPEPVVESPTSPDPFSEPIGEAELEFPESSTPADGPATTPPT
jgi:hypothetical protein